MDQPHSCLAFLSIAASFVLSPFAVSAAEDKPAAAAAIELGSPFLDNAILQREKPVPVWGWSKPGATITVEFAGQKENAKAGADGKWMLKLKPLKASATPAEMVVQESGDGSQESGKRVVLKNILVGEVWHASGQSNMEWIAGKSNVTALATEISKAAEELPIRELRTDTVSALYPQERVASEAGWKTSKQAGNFSALALSFAYEIHKELKVPVGILLTSHSNTRIEAFTERKAIEAHLELKEDADMIRDADAATEQGRAAFEKFYADLATWQKASAEVGFPTENAPPRPQLPGNSSQWRGPSQFYNGKISPVVPYAIRGSLWCQGEANEGLPIYAARMEALVKGWRSAWEMPDMPFYFTQMQVYGEANPEAIGMANTRQAQHMYFMRNRPHVGMVVQTDFNPGNPGGIHYTNKLHAGMRLARWALAKDYGRDIPYTGPIFENANIEGNKVVVSFEKSSLFGGLMVGSKGQEKDSREPEKYVEPARPTPGDKLNHFRLCGNDRKWFAADAVITGDTVVVTSKDVSTPIGVQYAYNAAPLNSNLYNKAGLPAAPFAVVEGKLFFQPGKASEAAASAEEPKILDLAPLLRDGIILQRDKPIPVRGYANKGVEVKVTLGDATQTAVTNDKQEWTVTLPARKASAQPLTLTVQGNNGQNRTVKDILIGDVWFLTGNALLTSQQAYDRRDPKATALEAMPLVREFRRRTKANTHPTMRKRYFEIGGDARFRGFWQTADFKNPEDGVTMFAYEFAKALNRPGVPQGFITMSGGDKDNMAAPLAWTSYAGVKASDNPAFKERRDAMLLQDPNSDVARKTIDEFVKTVKSEVARIADMSKNGGNMTAAPLRFPAFPESGQGGTVKPDSLPTLIYNFSVSPLTPIGVAGVVWVPSEQNIGYKPADYAAELEIYACSLPVTYGMDKVNFLYAQPSTSLVAGITAPKIANSTSVEFNAWPKSLKELAALLAAEAGKIK